MWRMTLIGTLAMMLAGTAAGAQDQKEQQERAERAAKEARVAEEKARREVEAVQKELGAEAANLDRANAERARAERQLEEERAKLRDRARMLADQQRQEVLSRRYQAELERHKAVEKARAAELPLTARVRDRFAARQPAMKREKVAFCGVGTSEPPPVLVNQLKLTPRMGLVVDFVEPGSPAEQSGIKQYDVLLKFDDQKLVNAEQFRSLVRIKKPGDDVRLSLVRQGQPMEVVLELGEKEVEEPVEAGFNEGLNFIVVPNGDLLRLDAGGEVRPRVIVPPGGEAVAVTNLNGRDQAVWTDGKHKLAMELVGGKAVKLKVSEQGGAGGEGPALFERVVATEQDRQAMPAEFREKLKKAEAALPKPAPAGAMIAPAPLPPAPAAPRRVTVRRFDDDRNLFIEANAALVPPGGLIVDGTNAADGGGRVRVVSSTDKDNLMLARIEAGKVVHVLVFSQADGKTLFEGPVATPDQRKALPEPAARQLDVLEKNQNIAPEFGVMGRN